jgi:hypothetical protein
VTAEGVGTAYILEVENKDKSRITAATVKGTGMTYNLEVEREARGQITAVSVKGVHNVQTGGGEGQQEVRSWL